MGGGDSGDRPSLRRRVPTRDSRHHTTVIMGKSTYGQILKSSSLIGGSQAVAMLLGFVRTKVLAVLLGPQAPVAVGLVGIFTRLTQLVNSAVSLGASGSGVREISLTHASGDQRQFAVVLKALRRMLLVIGLTGGAFMLCAAPWLSKLFFDDYEQTTSIRWLAVTVVLANISVTQGALLQGTRMIRQLAIVGIVTATVGTIGNIILYWKLGVNGVVPGLILIACVAPVAGWYYARRVPTMRIEQSLAETLRISKSLVTLGISFLAAGLLMQLVPLLIQTQISRQFGKLSLGHYTAAFNASGLIVNFILSAMMTDFFPRLTAATGSNSEMVRLINEQTEIGVLMSMPVLIGMLCFANWIIPLLYSKEFGPSIPMFCWLLLGCMGRVCSWPLGIVFAAQGKSLQIVLVELTAAAIHLTAVGIGLHFLGPLGASIAFPTLYAVYAIWMFVWMRKRIQFKYTRSCRDILIGLAIFLMLGEVCIYCLSPGIRLIVGIVVTAAAAYWCLKNLLLRVGTSHPILARLMTIRWISYAFPQHSGGKSGIQQ